MSALLAADWIVLLAFAVGAALGVLVGWLLRSWRETDEPTGGAAQPEEQAVQQQAPPAAARSATRTTRRVGSHEIDIDPADALGDRPAILLIDDRLEMLGIHAAYLRKHGYRTLLAEDGTTGLAFARQYRPLLIVLDHSMPDRTGVEVARELKADPLTADIPILLMTALSYGAVGAAAMEAGCAAYLPKPIEPSRLLREIQARTPPRH